MFLVRRIINNHKILRTDWFGFSFTHLVQFAKKGHIKTHKKIKAMCFYVLFLILTLYTSYITLFFIHG